MAEYTNQRRKDESFADYKERRKAQNAAEKHARNNGNILWDSMSRGTYVKSKHGEL